jgi:hypothetical protein
MDNLSIALHQVNRAIKLYLNERDYLSTITLGAAAESILVKLLVEQHQKIACEEVIFKCKSEISELSLLDKAGVVNYYSKRSTKRYYYSILDSNEISVDWEAKATELLGHCCDNILKLNISPSADVLLFIKQKDVQLIR